MKIRCNTCKHEWDYKGKQIYYCSCPRCLSKVKIYEGDKKQVMKQNEKDHKTEKENVDIYNEIRVKEL